jgi:hypothetical protein
MGVEDTLKSVSVENIQKAIEEALNKLIGQDVKCNIVNVAYPFEFIGEPVKIQIHLTEMADWEKALKNK